MATYAKRPSLDVEAFVVANKLSTSRLVGYKHLGSSLLNAAFSKLFNRSSPVFGPRVAALHSSGLTVVLALLESAPATR